MTKITEEETQRRRVAVASMLAAIAEGLLDGTFKEFKFDSREDKRKIVNAYTGKAINNGVPVVTVSFEMQVDSKKLYEYVIAHRNAVEVAMAEIEADKKATVNTATCSGCSSTPCVCEELKNAQSDKA